MCGLVGLHLKDPALEPRLGELLTPMLAALTTRGPDSAGIAMYGAEPPDGRRKFSLRAPGPDYPWEPLADRLAGELDDKVTVRSNARNADRGSPSRSVTSMRTAIIPMLCPRQAQRTKNRRGTNGM